MKKILVIDDANSVRKELVDLLKLENYEVLEAENGLRGYEMALEQLPDLIISDCEMPEMNGFDLIEKIRQQPNTKVIPFIFLSSVPASAIKKFSEILGAQEYIQKPYKSDELLAILNLYLKNQNYSLPADMKILEALDFFQLIFNAFDLSGFKKAELENLMAIPLNLAWHDYLVTTGEFDIEIERHLHSNLEDLHPLNKNDRFNIETLKSKFSREKLFYLTPSNKYDMDKLFRSFIELNEVDRGRVLKEYVSG